MPFYNQRQLFFLFFKKETKQIYSKSHVLNVSKVDGNNNETLVCIIMASETLLNIIDTLNNLIW